MISSLNKIEKGIILFWAIWATLVFGSDTINLLQTLQWLPLSWQFTSQNFSLVAKALAHYDVLSQGLPLILYTIIVIWILIIAILFWIAFFNLRDEAKFFYWSCWAFVVSMAQEAFFILADEVFINYSLEHGHMDRLGFRLITFLVFIVLSKKSDLILRDKQAS